MDFFLFFWGARKRKSPPSLAGFTLIEMLVVVAVLGIIVAIAVPALNTAKEQARTHAREAAAKTLNEALTRARLKNSTPTTGSPLYPGGWTPLGAPPTQRGGWSLEDRRAVAQWLVNQGYLSGSKTNEFYLEDLRFNVTDPAWMNHLDPDPPDCFVYYKTLDAFFATSPP